MTVTLTIDGQEVMVDGQATILEAAKSIGIEIPTFCYHPRLEIFGGCRMCLVEVDGWPKLETACTCKVFEGMVVYTDNPKVRAGRKAMLEFLLVNHPLDCPICDRSGACDLQDLVFKYGTVETRFTGQKRVLEDRVVNPLIDRNINRCIQCKRCVRICDEVQGVAALGMAQRGAKTVVVPFMDKVLDCEYCGHCIYSCPVGCVTSRPARHAARTWEMESVPTVCSFCSVGCTFDLSTRNGKVVKVSHREAPGVNDASLCSKGFFGYDTINNPARVLRPMVRKDGTLQETSWEEALGVVAQRMREIAGNGKGNLVGGIASTRITNEELFLFQKLMRTAFGSNNVDTPAGTWTRKVLPVLQERLGVWAAPNSLEEIADTNALLIVGCDITVSGPITGLKVKQALRRGAAVTEINPSATPLSRLGSRSLAIPVGSEISFVKGMIKVILDEKLRDSSTMGDFGNLADLEKTVGEKDLSAIALECGVGKEQIEQAAREFAAGEKASVLFGETAALQAGGEKLLQALFDLMLLTGKTGSEGCGIYPVFPAANFQGAVDMGVDPSWLPGRVSVESGDLKIPGLTASEMIQAAGEGRLSALYLVGANPFTFIPGSSRVAEALDKLDFLVVQDLFLTEAASKADVVLPAAGTAEKEGTLTSIERRVQKVRKAVPEPGKSLADWKIFTRIFDSLGLSGMGYASPEEVFREISEAVPYYSGMDSASLEDGGVQWPAAGGGSAGTTRLLENGVPADKKRFSAVSQWTTGSTEAQYPLTLIVGDLLFHSGSYSSYSENLNKIVSSAHLLIHPIMAAEAGIANESTARVSSRNGTITVPVRFSEDLVPGALFFPRHFADARVSELMVPGPGEESLTSVINVKIERAEE